MSKVDIATNKLHYKRIREDPMYRLWCEHEEMRLQLEPPLNTEDTQIPSNSVQPIIQKTIILDSKALELQQRIFKLETILSEHLNPKKGASKYKYRI